MDLIDRDINVNPKVGIWPENFVRTDSVRITPESDRAAMMRGGRRLEVQEKSAYLAQAVNKQTLCH